MHCTQSLLLQCGANVEVQFELVRHSTQLWSELRQYGADELLQSELVTQSSHVVWL